MLILQCTSCVKTLKVPDNAAGKRVRCPACGGNVAIPLTAAAETGARSHPVDLSESKASDHSEARVLQTNGEATIDGSNSPEQTLAVRPATPEGPGNLIDFLAAPQSPDELGRLGPYRVLKILGHGGMGVVYLAQDVKLKRPVALKVMLPNVAERETSGKRFLREAQLMAQLKHPHVVGIYQVDEDRGVPYLAMEFLEGEPLADRLKREGTLPISEVLRIGRQIAEGLQAAHERGLIHRDIKPGNIWLESMGPAPKSLNSNTNAEIRLSTPSSTALSRPSTVKILDFGLARTGTDDAHLTQSGAIVGTPAFMAPEQARGGKVDARCDLFSLGVVLYRMATGKMPFIGNDIVSTLVAVASDEPLSPRGHNVDIPLQLSELILKLLAKDPDRRFQSAEEVAAALRNLSVGTSMTTVAERSGIRTTATALPQRPEKRGRPASWLFVVIALALAGGLGWLGWQIVLRVPTPEGTLLIEVNDPEIEVAIKQGGVQIEHKSKKRTFTLRPGNGQITFSDPDSGVVLETKEFKIVGGQKELVTARLERNADKIPAKVEPPLADDDNFDVDRRAAEILKRSLNVRIRFGDGKFEWRYPKTHGDLDLPIESFRVAELGSPGNSALNPEQLAAIAALRHLTKINFFYRVTGMNASDDDVVYITKLRSAPVLQQLTLTDVQFTTKTVDLLKSLPKLTDIQLSLNEPNDAILEYIAREMPNLQQLVFSSRAFRGLPGQLTDKGFAALSTLRLTSFGIKSSEVPNGIFKAVGTIPSLTNLDVAGVDDGCFAALGKAPKLNRIGVSSHRLTDACLEALKDLPSLTFLSLDGKNSVTETGVRSLIEANPRITTVFLRGTKIQ